MRLPPLPRTKPARIALIAGAILFILAVILLLRSPAPEPVPPPETVISEPEPTPNAAAAQESSGKSQLILELFNPSDQSLTHQLTATALSQQIEQALTVSFILTKCAIIDQQAYSDTFRALIAYAARSGLAPDITTAETRVRQIAESSGASYSLIYSRVSCASPELPPLARQLQTWRELILTPSP